MKIMILDDDKICRRVNSESLRRVGYETIEAGSAKEAFDLLEKGEPIIMIVTDLRMPEMSGLDFVGRLRSDPGLGKIPIIICTSMDPKSWQDQMELFGISAYSPKPVNANHLRGKIGNVLHEETWPLEETFRSLMRLDISVEDYFACLDDLIAQLQDVAARAENQAQPMTREELGFELEALAGAAQNLGAQRIGKVLIRETEVVRGLAEGQKVAVSASFKRETGMLRLAMLILKKENEENIAARVAGKVATRQASKETRWKTALVSKQAAEGALPPIDQPAPAAAEAPGEHEAAPAAAASPSETPPVPSSS
ncbi:MAG TPA: response regulator [Candidatus Acidoferrales bacterium]|jgi:CheY-like chemotaxis protein|nr:response regulator [Candidatus Acidoferrales bacterium]